MYSSAPLQKFKTAKSLYAKRNLKSNKGSDIKRDQRNAQTSKGRATPKERRSRSVQSDHRSDQRRGLRTLKNTPLLATGTGNPIGIVQSYESSSVIPSMSFDMRTKSYAQGVKGVLLTGTSYLSTVNASVLSSKTLMYSTFLDPFSFASSRLSGIAKQFLKWKPLSLTFHFTPSVPSTSGGSYSLSILPDPNYPLYFTGDDLMRRVLSVDHSVICNLFTPSSTTFKWYDDEPWYYLNDDGSDIRFTTPGIFAMCCVNAPVLSEMNDVGTLSFSYEIALCGATYDLDQPVTTGTYVENSMSSEDYKNFKLVSNKFIPIPKAPLVQLRVTSIENLLFRTVSGAAISLKVGSTIYAYQSDVALTWVVCLTPAPSEATLLQWSSPSTMPSTGSIKFTYTIMNP